MVADLNMRRCERWQLPLCHHPLLDHFGPGRQAVQLRVKPYPPRLLFQRRLAAGRPECANRGVALAPSAGVALDAMVPAVVHEHPPHLIFPIACVFRCNPVTQLCAVCRAGFGIVPAANTGMLLLLNAPPSLFSAPRFTRLRPTGFLRVSLHGEVLCLELSPDIGRKHREVNAHLALNNAHFGNYIPTSIAIQFF